MKKSGTEEQWKASAMGLVMKGTKGVEKTSTDLKLTCEIDIKTFLIQEIPESLLSMTAVQKG